MGLRRVRIPASVRLIEKQAFWTRSLKVVYFAGRNRRRSYLADILNEPYMDAINQPCMTFRSVALVLCDTPRAFRSGDAAADAALRAAHFSSVADDKHYGRVLPPFRALGELLDRMGLLTDEDRAALDRIEHDGMLDFSRMLARYGLEGHTAGLMMHVNGMVSGSTWFEV